MALRDLLSRVFGSAPAPAPESFPPHIEAMMPALIELIAEEVEPRLKLLPGYRRQLEPSVRKTIAYMRSFGPQLEAPLELSPKNWSRDPRVNAFFATAGDVSATLGRSRALRAHFAARPGDPEAFAVLSMERSERSVLGVGLEGDTLRQDVQQTTVSFGDHRVAAPGASEQETRVELGILIFRGLLEIAMERIEALQARTRDLAEQRAMTELKLRRLSTRRANVATLAESPETHAGEIEELKRQLAQNTAEAVATKARVATLEGYVSEVVAVLDNPQDQFVIDWVTVRVNRMGIKVDARTDEPANEFRVAEIVARDFRRALALVRCRRDDLPPERAAFADAERYL
jgi:hypothetical protein